MILRTLLLGTIAGYGIGCAATITIDSTQGLFTSLAGVKTVAITPDSQWEGNNPVNPGLSTDHGAIWISDVDSGYGGTQFQQPEGTTPVVTVFDTFQSGAGKLTLNVWADDTASVLLDGTLLMPAVFTQSVCSGQAIGCRPQDVGNISAAISAGQHTLSFEMFQVGTGTNTIANPFGLLFTGTAPAATSGTQASQDAGAPEPGTFVLLASTLAMGWLVLKRRAAVAVSRRRG
jgi:hypothetical protein